jgi:hypothetical protein
VVVVEGEGNYLPAHLTPLINLMGNEPVSSSSLRLAQDEGRGGERR